MENENDEKVEEWLVLRVQAAEIAELTRHYNELSKFCPDYIALSSLSNIISEKYDAYNESLRSLNFYTVIKFNPNFSHLVCVKIKTKDEG